MLSVDELSAVNSLNEFDFDSEMTRCCGSPAWVANMKSQRPFHTSDDLFLKAKLIWRSLSSNDWKQAFLAHPRIGDMSSLKKKFAHGFESGEQSGANNASEVVLRALSEGNEAYENRYGHIFLICATGKSAEGMLDALNSRMHNDPTTEILIAANEQEKITSLRLVKLGSELSGVRSKL